MVFSQKVVMSFIISMSEKLSVWNTTLYKLLLKISNCLIQVLNALELVFLQCSS